MATNIDIEISNKLKDTALWFAIITLIGTLGILYRDIAILGIISLILLFIKGRPLLDSISGMSRMSGKSTISSYIAQPFLVIGYLIETILGILLLIFYLTAEGAIHISFSSFKNISYVATGVIGDLLLFGGVVFILFVGYLLIGLGIYEIGVSYNDRLTKIGGVVLIAPIIGTAGWILTYIGAFNVFRKMGGVIPTGRSAGIPMYSQAQYASIYQVGNGMLRYDGSAYFSLYSSTQGIQINNAMIQELGISAMDIQPRVLMSGTNSILAKFSPINTITQTGAYTIVLSLSNGQSILVKVNLASL